MEKEEKEVKKTLRQIIGRVLANVIFAIIYVGSAWTVYELNKDIPNEFANLVTIVLGAFLFIVTLFLSLCAIAWLYQAYNKIFDL